jgi:hypothetical protein
MQHGPIFSTIQLIGCEVAEESIIGKHHSCAIGTEQTPSLSLPRSWTSRGGTMEFGIGGIWQNQASHNCSRGTVISASLLGCVVAASK